MRSVVVVVMCMDLSVMSLGQGPLAGNIAMVLKQGILAPWHAWEPPNAHPAIMFRISLDTISEELRAVMERIAFNRTQILTMGRGG